MKKKKCRVCGTKLDLSKNKMYIAIETAGVTSVMNGVKKYECFDCDKCGCQNVVGVRMEKK